MNAKAETAAPVLSSICIDIGKDVFHMVGFDAKGQIILRKKIKRLALAETFKKIPPCIVGMEACLSAHFVSRTLRALGHEPRIIPAIYVKPFVKGQKNDYNDAEAIAEAALRPNLRLVREKSQDQLDLQACHRVRSRLVSRRTATINQIRSFLIERGIAVRPGANALRNSLFEILKNRKDEISPRMSDLIVGLYEDWLWLDERIETVTREIETISQKQNDCRCLMSIPGIGPMISTAMVAAIGEGEAFERGRDFGAWLGLVPRQYSTGGRSILGGISKRGSRYLRSLFIATAILGTVGNAHSFKNGRQFAASLGLVPGQRSSGGRIQLLGITKRGDTYLRKLLVQGARAIMRVAGRYNDRLSNWVRKLMTRQHKHVVAVALANKMARTIWALLVKGEQFEMIRRY